MELGEESIHEHKQLNCIINKYIWKNVVLVGGDFKNMPHLLFICFSNADEAAEWLQTATFSECYFLIKGISSMQMEKVLTAI